MGRESRRFQLDSGPLAGAGAVEVPNVRLAFGECVLDADSRELLRSGSRLDLTPKAFHLLELLLQARPRALSKAALHDELWPNTFVSRSSLPRLMAEVRAAVGDDARNPQLLRTVHRFGYAFFGAVAEAAPGARVAGIPCRLVWGEREIQLLPGENILGRANEARVTLDLGRVSRHHARIVVDGSRAVLEDLDSKNGTFVRGRRVRQAELVDGDEICIGPAVLVFRASPGKSTTETGE